MSGSDRNGGSIGIVGDAVEVAIAARRLSYSTSKDVSRDTLELT
jgi:hypothetical protein